MVAVVQFVHIAGGAVWLGGSLFANLVVLPYVSRQVPERQPELVRGLILGPERLMIGAALTAAATGLVRGIAYGRIRSLDVLGTPYGIVWLASVLVAFLVFAVGGRLTSPAAKALRDVDGARAGTSSPPVARLLDRVRLGFGLELAGITMILALMVLLAGL